MDYASLAQQFGGTATGGTGGNLDALAAQYGGSSAAAPAGGFQVPTPFPATGTESPGVAALKTVGNFVPSLINTGIGAVEMPFKVLGDIAGAPGALADAAGKQGIFPAISDAVENKLPNYLYNNFVPNLAKHAIEYTGGAVAKALAPYVGTSTEDVQAINARAENLQNSAITTAGQQVQENPVGEVLPFLLLGREAAFKVSPEAGAAFDATISKVASPVTAAGRVAGGVAGGALDLTGAMGRFGVSQATGLFPSTIETITQNPSAFSGEAMGGVNRIGVAAEIKSALDQRIADLAETGKQYAPIRNAVTDVPAAPVPTLEEMQAQQFQREAGVRAKIDEANQLAQGGMYSKSNGMLREALRMATDEGLNFDIGRVSPRALEIYRDSPASRLQPLDVENPPKAAPLKAPVQGPPTKAPASFAVDREWLTNTIQKTTGLTLRKGKLEASAASEIRDPKDINALQRLIHDVHNATFDRGTMTHNEFLNLRADLGKMSKYDREITKSQPLENLADIIRGRLNTAYRGKIPGLKELDARISPQFKELKALRKGLIDGNGNLLETAINRIANATGKGKDLLLERLEQLSPGITKKIQVLKAIEDIENAEGQKVGTYVRAGVGTTGVLAGIALGNIPLVASAVAEMIMASPSVAVPLMRAYGASKLLWGEVVKQLKGGLSAANQAPQGLGSLGELGPKAVEAGRSYFEKNPPSLGLSMRDVSRETPVYKGEKDLTLKTLEDLKGRTTVSKQYILDATNRGDIRQPERDIIRKTLEDYPDVVPVQKFADQVKTELLPLKRNPGGNRYEGVTLPDELRGPVADYSDHIYSSPIKTSAGDVHFRKDPYDEYGGASGANNYFAHTRVEDLPDNAKAFSQYGVNPNTGKVSGSNKSSTRRVIELQSDLFQKDRLEGERSADTSVLKTRLKAASLDGEPKEYLDKLKTAIKNQQTRFDQRSQELSKLEPYRNTWHERIINEEIKQAAKDGKTTVQFPTGDTAMKVEGLSGLNNGAFDQHWVGMDTELHNIGVGRIVGEVGGNIYVITKDLGDGKFALKQVVDGDMGGPGSSTLSTLDTSKVWNGTPGTTGEEWSVLPSRWTADEGGNVTDEQGKKGIENDPIYRFYEKEVGRYLVKKYGAKMVTDPQGVTWWEVKINPELAKLPITAYGKTNVGTLAGGAAAAGGAALALKSLGGMTPQKQR